MTNHYLLEKQALPDLITSLMREHTLIAPVKTDECRFEAITDPARVTLNDFPLFPAKKHFFPQHETLFTFHDGKLTPAYPERKPKVLLGLRRCDLNAIKHQDLAFSKEHTDPYYHKRRDATLLIGIHCFKPVDTYCFCGSTDIDYDAQDIMLYEQADQYLIEATTPAGEGLLASLNLPLKTTEQRIVDKKTPGTDNLTRINLNEHYNSEKWKEPASRCIDCGACNTLCPTCYCFEIKDETNFPSLTTGKRT
ncbi:MAG: hypothetical protein HC945_04300, partial [Nitrosarchaeum sp.]|nr:hypothetical protein [Nitrosarchaeum sp.]